MEVETFVGASDIDPRYFEKPYILVPGKKAEKGYVLLRETLRDTGKVGIAKVVIRTREYLAAVMPQGDALILLLLRYQQEAVDPQDFKLPAGAVGEYRITPKEQEMARQLIESMSGSWQPEDYHDEFRGKLEQLLRKRIQEKGGTTKGDIEPPQHEDATTNVVDFMSLLQKSLQANTGTPAKKSSAPAAAPAKKTATKKVAKKTAKKTATKAAKTAAAKAPPRRKAG